MTGYLRMIARVGFGWTDISDRLQQSPVVEPVHPFRRDEFDRLEAAPWAPLVNDLGLVEADITVSAKVLS